MTKTYKRIAAAAMLFAGLGVPARTEIQVTDPARLNAMLSSGNAPTVVDVRGASDFAKGHIPGALNVAYNAIGRAGLSKDRPVLLYCGKKCPLSHLAAKELEKAGYADVKVLDGGLDEWELQGFAVEAGGLVLPPKRAAKWGTVTAAALKKRLGSGGPTVIDTRPAQEFLAGRVPGARNVPLERLKELADGIPAGSELVVYDRDNTRAVRAVRMLAEKGFAVLELSGGLQVWTAARYPLEAGAAK